MSNTVFVNQPLGVRRTVYQNVDGALSLRIRYKSPNDVIASATATIVDTATGIISATIPADTLDAAGDWDFWAWVKFSDGGEYPGEVTTIPLVTEGNKLT